MALPAIDCDSINNYGKYVKDAYHTCDETAEAVSLIRKLLSEASEPLDLIAIGPLTNIARLLRSLPDEVSPLCGTELVRQKVSTMYVMGGSFVQNYKCADMEGQKPFTEWNILPDIQSARYVTEHFPSPMLFCPHEAGNLVLTDLCSGNNPVWTCMKQFAISQGCSDDLTFKRPSWDPIMCLCALDRDKPYFNRSAVGKIQVSKEGVTTFTECAEGNIRILLNKENFRDIAELINGHVEPLSQTP